MEPMAPIIIVDDGNGGHCRLRRRLIAERRQRWQSLSTMIIIDRSGSGMDPTVRRLLLLMMAAAKTPSPLQPSTAAADDDDHHRHRQ